MREAWRDLGERLLEVSGRDGDNGKSAKQAVVVSRAARTGEVDAAVTLPNCSTNTHVFCWPHLFSDLFLF